MNVPIDLSQVLFICTANTLETISAPLLDRCEIIQLSGTPPSRLHSRRRSLHIELGYTYDEKMHIARRFLLPKQLRSNGLEESHVTITEPALLHIVTRYTREAGVRSLERAIGAVVRCKAVEWAEFVDAAADAAAVSSTSAAVEQDSAMNKTEDTVVVGPVQPKKEYKRVVEEHELEAMLGIARWDGEEKEREERRGLVYGMVVMGQGEGGILPVETMAVPGTGKLKLTGSLGDVRSFCFVCVNRC